MGCDETGRLVLRAMHSSSFCFIGILLGHCIAGEHTPVPNVFSGTCPSACCNKCAELLSTTVLAATKSPARASLFSGTIFGALHWPNPVLGSDYWNWRDRDVLALRRERNILPLTVFKLSWLPWCRWAFPVGVASWHARRTGLYSFYRGW